MIDNNSAVISHKCWMLNNGFNGRKYCVNKFFRSTCTLQNSKR